MKQNLLTKDCSRSLFEVSTRWALAAMIVMPCGAFLASGAEKNTPDKPTVVSGDSTSKKSGGASKESPADRLAEILKDTDNDNRHLRLTEMGMEMGKTDPKRGWEMVLNNFTYLPDRQVFGMAVIRYWARKQPHEALEACKDIPEGERRALAYSGALEGWARVSPAEASDPPCSPASRKTILPPAAARRASLPARAACAAPRAAATPASPPAAAPAGRTASPHTCSPTSPSRAAR